MNDVLLSVQQVAEILHTSESTVRRMEEKGDLAVFGEGHYRFNLVNVLSISSETSRIKSKISIDGVQAKDLKDVLDKIENDERISIIIEEHDAPGPIATKYLVPHILKGFTTISVFGLKHGKQWILGVK